MSRRHGPPRCGHCNAVIVWFRSAVTGRWRKFDPRPVDPHHYQGPPAHPVENNAHWWHLTELVEDLRVRRETSTEQARDEAYDMPWYVPHDCSGGDVEDLAVPA